MKLKILCEGTTLLLKGTRICAIRIALEYGEIDTTKEYQRTKLDFFLSNFQCRTLLSHQIRHHLAFKGFCVRPNFSVLTTRSCDPLIG